MYMYNYTYDIMNKARPLTVSHWYGFHTPHNEHSLVETEAHHKGVRELAVGYRTGYALRGDVYREVIGVKYNTPVK